MLLVIRGGIRNLFGIWASKLGGGREFLLQESDGYVSWVVVISEVGTELYLLQCRAALKKTKQN